MIAWRILAETHSLTTTVTMMISRMSDTWVQASMVIAALSGRRELESPRLAKARSARLSSAPAPPAAVVILLFTVRYAADVER